ncbi:Hypothetical predicted protein [Pelobates cultripes]|uniref:Uncharacterized protein n=1 Tax=Pelobates cultripes TaxID=61616 RepID=A0AAD1T139_PELCU|nr:Hypothetical predicted protein [Pelobates cultripes]
MRGRGRCRSPSPEVLQTLPPPLDCWIHHGTCTSLLLYMQACWMDAGGRKQRHSAYPKWRQSMPRCRMQTTLPRKPEQQAANGPGTVLSSDRVAEAEKDGGNKLTTASRVECPRTSGSEKH